MRLEAEDLSAERAGRLIFSGLSLALGAGECLTVTGDNGAGKSTLLRVLAGLLPAASGRLVFAGEPVHRPLEHAHYIGHADALRGMLTLQENMAFWSQLLRDAPSGEAAAAAAAPYSCADALSLVGLSHATDLPAGFLSAGQKRRAALAKLLVAPRPLWLLDEPLTALDARSQTLITGLMARHLKDGGMIVTATHAPLDLPGQALRLGAPSRQAAAAL